MLVMQLEHLGSSPQGHANSIGGLWENLNVACCGADSLLSAGDSRSAWDPLLCSARSTAIRRSSSQRSISEAQLGRGRVGDERLTFFCTMPMNAQAE